MKNTGNSKKAYIVTVTVKNGPFTSQTAAGQSKNVLTSRGISTSSAKKTAKGYFFTSKVKYRCASASIREKLINQVYSFAKASGISPSSIKITSKVV